VWFRFDPAGARIFEDITSNNIGRRFAIVLDDNVYSAPNIRERIPGGQGQISGSFTLQQAEDLAIVLRAGSLPAPVEILENRTVGPSLGADSIAMGVRASIIGFTLVVLFMLIYYRLSGLVANIGLMCNFVVLLGVLCLLNATLTLPGIAGIILALGIAVDANVLIFERVREELRSGRTVMNAFEIGYQKAFNTIVDANVTSLIASIVLFQFGTGPVKGFAVTLSIGLIASMFTAVFVTKTIFMTFILRNDPEKISI
jgi:preprotein translocase subunit SecD